MKRGWECPKCGNYNLYRLGQERVKCSLCLERFKLSELFPQTVEELRQLFDDDERERKP